MHSGADQLTGSAYSLVDYNRAGQALLEIVSEPDMRSGQDAAAYGAELRRIMVFLGVSDGEMSVSKAHVIVHITVEGSLSLLAQDCSCSVVDKVPTQAQCRIVSCMTTKAVEGLHTLFRLSGIHFWYNG